MTAETIVAVTSRETFRDRWTLSKRSPRTTETYEQVIGAWFAFCDRTGVDVFAVEQHHADAYRQALVRLGRQPATVAKHLSTVSSFYRYVQRHGRPCPVDRNPAEFVDRPEVDLTSRRDGLDAAEGLAMRAASLVRGPRTAALVHLLLGTAVRVSEACGATCDGLGWSDAGERTLQVVRKGGRPDVVTIEDADWQVIDAYLTTRPEAPWLFATTGGRQMSRRTAYRLVSDTACLVVGDRKKIGPHSLRHTVATLALDAQVPIQEVQGLLRHASSATTQRYDGAWRDRGRVAQTAVNKIWTEGA